MYNLIRPFAPDNGWKATGYFIGLETVIRSSVLKELVVRSIDKPISHTVFMIYFPGHIQINAPMVFLSDRDLYAKSTDSSFMMVV